MYMQKFALFTVLAVLSVVNGQQKEEWLCNCTTNGQANPATTKQCCAQAPGAFLPGPPLLLDSVFHAAGTRMKGMASRKEAHESQKALATAQEAILVKWIELSRLAQAGADIAGYTLWETWARSFKARYYDELRGGSGRPLDARSFSFSRRSDRAATAHKHPSGNVWFKMIAGKMDVAAPPDFWEFRKRPLVTYVSGSRQAFGRRLVAADHDALRELEADGGCDFKLAAFEYMSPGSRLSLRREAPCAGRRLMSVAAPVVDVTVAVVDDRDYEMVARIMGHWQYALWTDTFFNFEPGTYHEVQARNIRRDFRA
ncbi:hypothetical protein GGX14DRAFT_701761 [Mycena pura]|uniref:Uncharacterized protein n=1 Tax=Mycena pura TaxID=153505 RepID=A0AAD6UMY4_9AGAR|nr:hypothetical protein GGX14DRAFT_701761 [Mycena pura]